MNTKILADFQICISVPLMSQVTFILSCLRKLDNSTKTRKRSHVFLINSLKLSRIYPNLNKNIYKLFRLTLTDQFKIKPRENRMHFPLIKFMLN